MNKILDMTLIKNGWLWAAGLAVMTLALPMSLAKEVTKFETIPNVNMASAGIGGLRGAGTGTIQLAGVPGTATVRRALLYWHGPINSDVEVLHSTVSLNGNSVTGDSLGQSFDNNWYYPASQAFRADVTQWVRGDGDYVFIVSEFDPMATSVNGASLIVFYDDGDSANDRDYVVFNGNDSNGRNNYDFDGWNAVFSGVYFGPGNPVAENSVNLQLHVSDGQKNFQDAPLILNTVNTLASGPYIFSGDSVPIVGGGTGPDGNGGLWDIRNFELKGFLHDGPNAPLRLTIGLVDDFFSLVVGILDLPVGTELLSQQSDNHSPTVICTGGVTVQKVSPSGTEVTLSADVSDSDGDPLTVIWSVNGVQVAVNNISSGGPPTSATAGLTHIFTSDINTVNVTVIDSSAAANTCATAVSLVDTTPPTVDCGGSGPIIVEADHDGTAVVPDLKGQVTILSDNGTPITSLIIEQQPAFGDRVGIGDHTITVTVKDAKGNHSDCTTTLTVKSAAKPVSVVCGVASPMLWPPNHKLVNVGFTATALNAVGPVQIQVFSDEDDVPALGRDDRDDDDDDADDDRDDDRECKLWSEYKNWEECKKSGDYTKWEASKRSEDNKKWNTYKKLGEYAKWQEYKNYKESEESDESRKLGKNQDKERSGGENVDDSDNYGDCSNFSPDAKDLGIGTLRLRSERLGTQDGRVYLIVTSAVGATGDTATCLTTVVVPHDQSQASINLVNAQAAAAQAYYLANGTPPPGYSVVGDGPVIGPKQ